MPTLEQQQIAALKSDIFKLEAKIEFLYNHLNLTYVQEVTPADDPEIVEALRTGNVVEAIKIYRLKFNAGLADAKNAVDGMRARLGM